MKKVILVCAILLTLVGLPQISYGETNTSDTSAPIFKSLSLDKNVIFQGEEQPALTVTAEDESAITRVEVIYLNSKKETKSFTLEKTSESTFTGKLDFTSVDRYQIQQIILEDEHNHTVQVWNPAAGLTGKVMVDLAAGNVQVKRITAEFYKTKIKDVIVTTADYGYVTTLHPKLIIEPTIGLETVKLVFRSTNSQEEYDVTYQYFDDENTVVHAYAPSTMDNGPWELKKIILNPDNHPVIIKDVHFPNATFELDNIAEPLTIEQVQMEKNELQMGDRVNISLKATINTKQDYYYLKAVYEAPVTKRLVKIPIGYDEKDKLFKSDQLLTGFEPGDYTFKYFEIHDNQYFKIVDTSYPKLNFTYYGDKFDQVVPTLNSILWVKGNSGDYILPSVNKTSQVYFVFFHPESGERVETYHSWYSYMYSFVDRINPKLAEGEWFMEKVIIRDSSPIPYETIVWNEDFAPNNTVKMMDLSSFDLLKEEYEVKINDRKPPKPPVVDEVTDLSTSIKGKSDKGTTIEITIGGKIYTVPASSDSFSKSISRQAPGTKIQVVALDHAKNKSKPSIVTVKDVTRPAPAKINDITNKSKTITGTAQPGAQLTAKVSGKTIGKATVASSGKYSIKIPAQKEGKRVYVYITDGSKLSSKSYKTVKDVIAPSKPKVNKVTVKSKYVTGKTEPYAYVHVKGKGISKVKRASKYGNYKIAISKQKYKAKLRVNAVDKAGNKSKTAYVTVRK